MQLCLKHVSDISITAGVLCLIVYMLCGNKCANGRKQLQDFVTTWSCLKYAVSLELLQIVHHLLQPLQILVGCKLEDLFHRSQVFLFPSDASKGIFRESLSVCSMQRLEPQNTRGQFFKPLANGLTSACKVCKCLLSFLKKGASGFASTGRSKSAKGHGQVFTCKSGVASQEL